MRETQKIQNYCNVLVEDVQVGQPYCMCDWRDIVIAF